MHSEEQNRVLLSDPSTGGVYVIATRIATGNVKSDLLITKTDLNGNHLWQEVFTSVGDYNEIPSSAVVDHQGNIIITGEQFNASNFSEVLVVKYSPSGTLQWSDTIDGSGHRYDKGFSVCVDDSDNIYVSSYIFTNTFCGGLTKYSPSGSRIFNIVIPTIQQASDVDYKNGYLYLSAMTGTTGFPYHTALYKFTSDGNYISFYLINNSYDNLIIDKVVTDSLIYLLEGESSLPFTWPSGTYGITCIDTALNYRWSTVQSTLFNLSPSKINLVGNSLYVAGTEYFDTLYSTCGVDVRCFAAADGQLLHQTFWQGSSDYVTCYDQAVDSNGTVSIASLSRDSAGQNYSYQYLRFDSTLVMQQLLVLPDSMVTSNIFLSQYDNQNVFYSAKAMDSSSVNNDLVLYRLSNNSVIISDPWLGGPFYFPNPASHEISFYYDTSTYKTWSLITADGKIAVPITIFPPDKILHFNVSSGVYFLQLNSSNQTKSVRVVVK
ncbi:MAG: T9SS type A sorting domain-containing protein [Bacteroidia bacterium]